MSSVFPEPALISSQPATSKCKILLFKKQKKRKKLTSPNSYRYATLKAIHWTWPFSRFTERKWKEFGLCWAQKFWKAGGCLRFSVTKCNRNRRKPSAASGSTDCCPHMSKEVTGTQQVLALRGPKQTLSSLWWHWGSRPFLFRSSPGKLIMNGTTAIKNISQTSSYSLI